MYEQSPVASSLFAAVSSSTCTTNSSLSSIVSFDQRDFCMVPSASSEVEFGRFPSHISRDPPPTLACMLTSLKISCIYKSHTPSTLILNCMHEHNCGDGVMEAVCRYMFAFDSAINYIGFILAWPIAEYTHSYHDFKL
ncbi:hypothetical protein EJ03DRAFT_67610 [Teratosphaeria nubilosa]|uniref:Uncharacterized protein n=1 Tax=Teratosphaeria nubilosa TaxID=161662 RepID=A0A6G1LBV8_9PEZI|nr:hypothetical protein EJ03DRAFT_67610 [Teratosphaeria nubilosa]